eukprot:4576873-Lingulodinium_polyedra.AAC.1
MLAPHLRPPHGSSTMGRILPRATHPGVGRERKQPEEQAPERRWRLATRTKHEPLMGRILSRASA